MKLSNFRDFEILHSGTKVAKVDVDSGWGPFKKKSTENIAQDKHSAYWYFVSTGEYTPGHEAEYLSKAYFTKLEMKKNAT